LRGIKKARRDLNGIPIGIPTKKIKLKFNQQINSLLSQFNLQLTASKDYVLTDGDGLLNFVYAATALCCGILITVNR
jgi:hypothetical protein